MIPEFVHAMKLPEISVEKGTVLVNEGNVCKDIWFLKTGIARLFFIYRRKELTTQFFFPGDVALSAYSFLTDQPSTLSVVTLESTQLLVMDKAKYKEETEKNETFRKWFYHIAMKIEFAHSNHLQSMLRQTAKDKLSQIWREQPELMQRVSARYLASHLGISPAGLDITMRRLSKLQQG